MKTHLSLETNNIDASVAFYQILLNAKPDKHYEDYALFLTEQPGLELALEPNHGESVIDDGSTHFGIAVDTAVQVEAGDAESDCCTATPSA